MFRVLRRTDPAKLAQTKNPSQPRMWFLGETFTCPRCDAEFEVPEDTPERSAGHRPHLTDPLPVGVWEETALVYGGGTRVYGIRCPVCTGRMLILQRRVGWPWRRRWMAEPAFIN